MEGAVLGLPRARLEHHVARQSAERLRRRAVAEGAEDPLLIGVLAHDIVQGLEKIDGAIAKLSEAKSFHPVELVARAYGFVE